MITELNFAKLTPAAWAISKAGEYMIYTDGITYRCLSDTNFSPEEYPEAWERVEA